jgi:peptidoglycan/xylan/chitin deacetylase (PgdA/CDA1 family)
VIVVDDDSADDTAKVLEPLSGRIQLIRQQNAGVAAARNTGIRAARGELIAFLDADDVWLPLRLERQVSLHQEDDSLGLTHCGLTEVDQDLHPLRDRLDGLAGDDVARTMLWGQGDRLHAIGSTMVVTRAAIEAVGDFDVGVAPSEDWELMYRIARRFRIGFVPEPLVFYRQHPGNAHRNIPRQERSMMLALGRVFERGDADVEELRRRAYATVHSWLAGCYWEIGARGDAVRHAAAAAWLHPPMLTYLAAYPIRHFSRGASDQSSVTSLLPRRAAAPRSSPRFSDLARSEIAKRWYFRSMTRAGLPRSLLRRRVRHRALLVLNLHSVSSSSNPFWPSLDPELFESLVCFLSQNCVVTTFGGIGDASANTDQPLAVLSFDDGYQDFVDIAMPIMKRYGVVANQNVIGECVETGNPPWIVRVSDELDGIPVSRLRRISLPGVPMSLTNTAASKQRFGAVFTNYLKSLPQKDSEAIWSEVKRSLGEFEVRPPRPMMGSLEIQAAIDAGHEIGMHSYSHESMELVDADAFAADLLRAQDALGRCGTGAAPVYAFPNGSHRPEQIRVAQELGIRHVLLIGERPSRIGAYVHTRVTVRGESSDETVLRALGHRPPLGG